MLKENINIKLDFQLKSQLETLAFIERTSLQKLCEDLINNVVKNNLESINKIEALRTKNEQSTILINEGTDGVLGKLYNKFTNDKSNENRISEQSLKISKSRRENKTGIYRVSYSTIGTWRYSYFRFHRQNYIYSVDLNKLKEKVEAKGLEWKILDKEKAEQSYKKNEEIIKEKFNKKATRTISGIDHVSYNQATKRWGYQRHNPRIMIYDKNLRVLEKKVKDAGYEWIILDKEKAEYSYKHNKTKPKNQNASGIRKRKLTGISKDDLKNEDNPYTYPVSYIKYLKLNLRDDGTFSLNKSTQSYDNILLLKIFYNTQPNLKIRDFNRLKKLETHLSRSLIMNIAYYFDKELRGNGGDFCDAIFTIFKNDYEVPRFVSFTGNGEELLVNNHKTGITLNKLKQMIDECNGSFNQEYTITKLMHDNPKVNKKYLFWTLMNFGNPHISEILKEADL